MESLNTLKIYKELQKQNVGFLDYDTLASFTGQTNKNTIYKTADRLIEKGVLTRLTDGKFVVNDDDINEFEIANFIYQPSYISLESALSYYGILSQFPYSITSVTTSKSKKVSIQGKEYTYSTIKKELFTGYVKLGGFLIATKEKALADTIYFDTKGLVQVTFDDLDLSTIDKDALREILKKFNKQVNLRFEEILNDRK